ncbi:MAG: hypothetical protein LBP38_02015 [Desulfovibrio sp.]|nr:hypothetical protein [Desulfovibrio sp.]
MLTAYTREIDDIERAAAEIRAQLQLDERLLRRSVAPSGFWHFTRTFWKQAPSRLWARFCLSTA